MAATIVATRKEHLEGLYRALDAVARERSYLTLFEAPPRAGFFATFEARLADGIVHFVTVEGDELLGWCELLQRGRRRTDRPRPQSGLGPGDGEMRDESRGAAARHEWRGGRFEDILLYGLVMSDRQTVPPTPPAGSL